MVLVRNVSLIFSKYLTQNGTGKDIQNFGFKNIASKTGSTNVNTDAWFIGITPELTTGVWVGWKERYCHFNTGLGQGSKSALPVCGIYLKSVYKNKKLNYSLNSKFQLPKGYKPVNCNSLINSSYGENYGTIDDFE